MAVVDKEIQQSLDNLIELHEMLFPDGEIPAYEDLFAKAEAGEPFTVREAYAMRFYSEGIAITPAMEKNAQTKEIAKELLTTFGKASGQPATIGGHKGQLQNLVDRGVPLDRSFDDFYRESKATKKFSGIAKNINALQASVEKFKKGTLAPKAAGESRKLKRVPTKATITAIVEGIGRIPDPELRDAVFISVFGMRGAQLADIAVDYETATGTESVRPYFNPETGVLESPDPHYATRKPLPPSKTMGPIATQILQRRHAAALEAGETRLFPNVESKDISTALKRFVFNEKYFPQSEVDHLGKRPSGITDLRKIFVSYTVKELGDAKLADELLGHPDSGNKGVVDEAISKVGAKFYLTTDATGPEVYGNLLTRLEQDMGKAANKSSFTTLAESMRIEVPQDILIQFVDFDAPQGFVETDSAGQARPEVVERSPEQIAQAQRTAEALDKKNEEIALKEAEEAGLKREQTRKARLEAKAEADELADEQPTKADRAQARTSKRFNEISDKVGAALQGFFDDLDLPALGGLAVGAGVVGGALSYSEAVESFEKEGVDPTTAKVLGGVQATYETIEPPTLGLVRESLRIQPAGGPEDVLGETEEQRAYAEQMGGIETEFSRGQQIKALDRQQAVVAEQQRRIAEYDAKMASQQGQGTDQQMNQLLRNISGE